MRRVDVDAEWVRCLRANVEWCVGRGSRFDDALGCLIAGHVRFTLPEREHVVSVARWDERRDQFLGAIERHDSALLREAGWPTVDGFGRWFETVYGAWARAGTSPSRRPTGALGKRFDEIDRLQAAIEDDAARLGVLNRPHVRNRAIRGMGRSRMYDDRTPTGRAEIRSEWETALIATVGLFGHRAFTIGPNGEGVSDRAVREAHGGKRRAKQAKAVSLEGVPEQAAAEDPAAVVEGADLCAGLVDTLDASDQLILKKHLAGESNAAIGRMIDMTGQGVGQRLAAILSKGKRRAGG